MSVKNVKRGILLSLLFFLVFFIDGKAQDKTHRIEGEVSADSGMPVEFVTVKLLDAADSTLITAMYADEKGVFKFDNVICDKAYLLKLSNI